MVLGVVLILQILWLEPFLNWLLFGIVLSGICVVVFLILWIVRKIVSVIPCAYSLGAFWVFILATNSAQNPGVPIHFWIGLYCGWLMLALAFIQVFYEVIKKGK